MHETRIFDIAIEICVIFLLVFMPFAFGGVGLGPQIVLISVSQLVFLLFLAKAAKTGDFEFKGNIFLYVFIAFLAVIFFQAIPLPEVLLKLLSPATNRNYIEFLPGYKENPSWRSISVFPAATQIEMFKILSYGLVSLVIVNTFNKKEQLARLLAVISITGFAVACFGIIQRFTWNGMIYWVQPVPEGASPFGPFVNKNHFAGFMELTIAITAAFVFMEKQTEKKILFGFMAIAMLLALFLCLSRAGIVSFFAASGIGFSIIFLRRSFKKYIFYAAPVILAVSVLLFFIVRVPLIERFSTSLGSAQGRWHMYKDVIEMSKDYPLFGAGLGNFAAVFPMYKTTISNMIFSHADSDWLQFLSETGLIGFLCIAVFIWFFFKDILYCHFLGKGRCVLLKDINLRHDRFVLLVISAGIVSLSSIVMHGMVDINLHIPSNMLLTCIIGALLMIAAHVKFKEDANG